MRRLSRRARASRRSSSAAAPTPSPTSIDAARAWRSGCRRAAFARAIASPRISRTASSSSICSWRARRPASSFCRSTSCIAGARCRTSLPTPQPKAIVASAPVPEQSSFVDVAEVAAAAEGGGEATGTGAPLNPDLTLVVAARHRLHLGHHRHRQGRHSHARQFCGERAEPGRGVALHRRRPAAAAAAALSRAWTRQRCRLLAGVGVS